MGPSLFHNQTAGHMVNLLNPLTSSFPLVVSGLRGRELPVKSLAFPTLSMTKLRSARRFVIPFGCALLFGCPNILLAHALCSLKGYVLNCSWWPNFFFDHCSWLYLILFMRHVLCLLATVCIAACKPNSLLYRRSSSRSLTMRLDRLVRACL